MDGVAERLAAPQLAPREAPAGAWDREARVRSWDWRALLPEPAGGAYRHLVILGGPPGLEEDAVRGGVAHRASRTAVPGTDADALVVLHDADTQLDASLRCLAPDGVVYVEVDRRRRGRWADTPGRTARRLRRAGLTPSGTYWAGPDFASRQLFLPLDGTEALRWYLRVLFSADGVLRRALRPCLRLMAAVGYPPLAPLVPCFAVTARRGGPARGVPTGGRPVLPASLRRPGLRPLVLTPGADPYRRVVVLPFEPGSADPVGVLKFWRIPDRGVDAVREQHALREIRGIADAAMRATLPVPLGTAAWGDLTVSAESYLPGAPLLATTTRWGSPLRRKAADLHDAAAWLGEFHRGVPAGPPLVGGAELRRWIEPALAEYRRTLAPDATTCRLLDEVLLRTGTLDAGPVARVHLHWDFTPRNVFRAAGGIAVLDWPGGEKGLPLFDLLFFALHWASLVGRARTEADRLRCFRRIFVDPPRRDPVAAEVRRAVRAYLAAAGLDARYAPAITVHTWALHALYRAGRPENPYVAYLAALAERPGSLFESMER